MGSWCVFLNTCAGYLNLGMDNIITSGGQGSFSRPSASLAHRENTVRHESRVFNNQLASPLLTSGGCYHEPQTLLSRVLVTAGHQLRLPGAQDASLS